MTPFKGAWKKVMYINRYEKRGRFNRIAVWYRLTLECDHHKTVHGGTSSPLDLALTKRRLRGAPRKVRCLICPA